MKGYIRRTADEHRKFAMLAPKCHHSGTQELFTKFGTEPKLELSSFRGRAVPRASHDSNRSRGAFVFHTAVPNCAGHFCETCLICPPAEVSARVSARHLHGSGNARLR